MSLGHGASIVRSGLSLNMDAANRKSYPGSGTSWNDLSGNGNNGTLTNGPTFDSAGSINFDGTDDYVSIPSNSNCNFTVGSVECWAKLTSASIGGQCYSRTNTLAGTFNMVYNGGAWQFNIRLSTTTQYQLLANATPTTLWTHLVGTYDGIIQKFYVNSILQTATTSISGTLDTAGTLVHRIGQNTSGISPFNGKISVVKLYNRALTASEISQNFEALRGRYGV